MPHIDLWLWRAGICHATNIYIYFLSTYCNLFADMYNGGTRRKDMVNETKTVVWNVLGLFFGEYYLVDKVTYDDTCDAEYIRKQLIEHDGYTDDIKVEKADQ